MILIKKQVIELLLAWANNVNSEIYCLLDGKVKKDQIEVTGLVYQPYSSTEEVAVPLPLLGTDTTGTIGIAHSHPLGSIKPSRADKEAFSQQLVNIITNGKQYEVYDSVGKPIPFKLI